MRHSPHHRLLDDTLHSDALAESLASTRRVARGRRVARRTIHVGAVGAFLLAAVLVLIRPPRSPVTLASSRPHLPAPAALPPPPKPHLLIATPSGTSTVVVRTTSHSKGPALAKGSVEIVSTRTAFPSTLRASEDDLFAAAGPRPAAMHHLPDGSARWIWLDPSTSAR